MTGSYQGVYVRHDNIADNPRWLTRLSQRDRPDRVVNHCFIIVLFFATLLTWREVAVLESAYVSSQHNSLSNVAHVFDTRLQFSVDNMKFFRISMQSAMQTPLAFEVLRNARDEFERKRQQPEWLIELDNHRTLPVKGVSDAFVEETQLLSRDHPFLDNEITAALELGYILRLAHNGSRFALRTQYVSRSGFYISTDDTDKPVVEDIITRYYDRVAQSWFSAQTQRDNHSRGIIWHTTLATDSDQRRQILTASLPLDYQHYWLGVLAMDFDVASINAFLREAASAEQDGSYQLYNARMDLIANTGDTPLELDTREQARLAGAIAQDTRGGIRLDQSYISWEHLKNFDGVILRIHTLAEGVRSDFGTISIALTLLWFLFTSILLISWIVIRRMVSNMIQLQYSLEWRAWYDTLTRLFNRGMLFERAGQLVAQSHQRQQSVAVIQLDLDHFKNINDTWGHQAGDRVLAHVAGLIGSTLRDGDIAGRVGGEEFSILLPATTLAEGVQMAERIRQRINAKEILVRKGTTIKVSASLGVSCSEEHQQYDFELLQSVADNRLYRAKQMGRNRVHAAD